MGENHKKNNRLKIAFLVDQEIDHYAHFLVSKILDERNIFQKPLFLRQIESQKIVHIKKNKINLSSIENIFWRILLKIDRFFSFGRDGLIASKSFSIEDCSLKIINIFYLRKDYSFFYDESSLDQIKAENIDVIIRLGKGIQRGKILRICKYGILSIHNDDNRVVRGGPACFWETLWSKSSVGYIIQKLTDELDGGDVISRGDSQTRNYFSLNQDIIYKKSYHDLFNILTNLSNHGNIFSIEDKVIYGGKKCYKEPSLDIILIYLCKSIFLKFSEILSKFLIYPLQIWNIRYLPLNSKNIYGSELYKAKSIDNPKYGWLADPFVYSKNNRNFIFAEHFDYRKAKGVICCYEIKVNNVEYLGTVIEEDFHLSYPYIFEYQNNVYMIPESSSCNQVRLYRADEFPLSWSFVKTIFEGESIADPNIIYDEKSDAFFLIANPDLTNTSDFDSFLNIYFSKNLLRDNFQPIPINPINKSSKSSRNGGVFILNNSLFRVNQIHKKGIYGCGITLNKIIKLSETEFEETPLSTVFGKEIGFKGIHHFHSNSFYTVFDVLQYKIPINSALFKFKKLLKRIFSNKN